jgi:hypothetical protein
MATCSPSSSSSAAFAYLANLHFRKCDANTPVVQQQLVHAGLGNAIGQMVLGLHFAALHNRTLVVMPDPTWVWTNGTGFEPGDIFWPSSCDLHVKSRPDGIKGAFRHSIRMLGINCPTYGCSWANKLPPGFGSDVPGCPVYSWYSHLLTFLLRPSARLMDWLQAVGRTACQQPLCGGVRDREDDGGGGGGGGGGGDGENAQRRRKRRRERSEDLLLQHLELVSRRERRLMPPLGIIMRSRVGGEAAAEAAGVFSPSYRPPFRSNLALRLQLLSDLSTAALEHQGTAEREPSSAGAVTRVDDHSDDQQPTLQSPPSTPSPPLPPRPQPPLIVGLHLRAGDACTGSRPYWQRPLCVYSEVGSWTDGWPARVLTKLDAHRRRVAGGVSSGGAPPMHSPTQSSPTHREMIILLSTDSSRAYERRENEIGAALNATAVHAFRFRRAKYGGGGRGSNGVALASAHPHGVQFVETRLASGALSGRLMLAEALLDLGLLSQASVVVGSMYSNFGRLALQLTGNAAYESFDAYWCPYHMCQAGCNDVDRLCDQPSQLGESELSRGQRGGFEPFGVQPRRLKPPNASGLIEETIPARRAWVRLMLRLVGSKQSREVVQQPAVDAGGTNGRGATPTGTGAGAGAGGDPQGGVAAATTGTVAAAAATRDGRARASLAREEVRAECRRAFEEAATDLATNTPKLY